RSSDIHSGNCVEGDNVAGAGGRASDGRVGHTLGGQDALQEDTVLVAEIERDGRIGADEIALDHKVVRAAGRTGIVDLDAATAAANDVTLARARSADGVIASIAVGKDAEGEVA